MSLRRAWMGAFCLVLMSGCNAILGADEPEVAEGGGEADDVDEVDPTQAPGRDPKTPGCGNGVIDTNEQCDDANDVADDGCDECLVECANQAPELLGSNNTCYLFIGSADALGWKDAREQCDAAFDGDLASLADANAYAEIQNRVGDSGVWVGGEDLDGDGAFEWLSGDAFAWEDHFASGFPVADARCLSLTLEGLENQNCEDTLGFVCARLPPGDPKPVE